LSSLIPLAFEQNVNVSSLTPLPCQTHHFPVKITSFFASGGAWNRGYAIASPVYCTVIHGERRKDHCTVMVACKLLFIKAIIQY